MVNLSLLHKLYIFSSCYFQFATLNFLKNFCHNLKKYLPLFNCGKKKKKIIYNIQCKEVVLQLYRGSARFSLKFKRNQNRQRKKYVDKFVIRKV